MNHHHHHDNVGDDGCVAVLLFGVDDAPSGTGEDDRPTPLPKQSAREAATGPSSAASAPTAGSWSLFEGPRLCGILSFSLMPAAALPLPLAPTRSSDSLAPAAGFSCPFPQQGGLGRDWPPSASKAADLPHGG
jgi:hypothetical protein